MSALYILMFGNLLFLILDKQLALFTTQNIYIPASLLLNIILLLELRVVSNISKRYLLFFCIALIGPVTSYLVLNFDDFISVTIKYIWILSSVILINHLVNSSNKQDKFIEIQSFAILTGYIILVNIFLSIIFINEPIVPNEGIKSLLISSDSSKKLCLLVLPFFFMSDRRHIATGSLLLIYLLLGTRALIVSSMFLFLFFM